MTNTANEHLWHLGTIYFLYAPSPCSVLGTVLLTVAHRLFMMLNTVQLAFNLVSVRIPRAMLDSF